MNSHPATREQSGAVRLPVIRSDRDYIAARSVPTHGHRFAVGDALSIMSWDRMSYDRVTVTYCRRGESVNVRDEWTGETRSLTGSELMFLASQAVAHHGTAPDMPGVGIIVPTAGPVHHITASGACLVCKDS